MAGIIGINRRGEMKMVLRGLEKIVHRGTTGSLIMETEACTLALAWPEAQPSAGKDLATKHVAVDKAGDGHFAIANCGEFFIKRDPIGVAPLYYGFIEDDLFCFASEVKGMLEFTRDVHELLPGHIYNGRKMEPYFQLKIEPQLKDNPRKIAQGLRKRLEAAIEKRTGNGDVGGWLSGGLDSSVLAALARPHFATFHTFTAGLPGAPDVENAQLVADYIHSEHHSLEVKIDDMLAVLPEVIYHLESFDAWLVRSSILNYLVAKLASDYVPAILSGEGGDELFAGYEYLKSLKPSELADELIDIISRLHNTALQRVDRCASAHGTVAHVIFLDPEIIDYALRIPVEFKLKDGIEKWILRQAVADILPEAIVNRPKAKFWEGAGVHEIMAQYAENIISDTSFAKERTLPNGWQLESKEELLYYGIFREHFGEFDDLNWMGRTKK